MSKIKMSLSPDEVQTFFHYLEDVLTNVVQPDSIPLEIIVLNASRVFEKLAAKQLLMQSVSLKLPREQALALQWLMAVYIVPPNWVYTANVVRLVQSQLPEIEIPNPHQGKALLPGPQMLNHG